LFENKLCPSFRPTQLIGLKHIFRIIMLTLNTVPIKGEDKQTLIVPCGMYHNAVRKKSGAVLLFTEFI